TGLRPGELLALRLSDIDLEGATLRVERSLEQTKNGLRFEEPKTKHGKRTLSLPPNVVAVLRDHRRTARDALDNAARQARCRYSAVRRAGRRAHTTKAPDHSMARCLHQPRAAAGELSRAASHACIAAHCQGPRCRSGQPPHGPRKTHRDPQHLW